KVQQRRAREVRRSRREGGGGVALLLFLPLSLSLCERRPLKQAERAFVRQCSWRDASRVLALFSLSSPLSLSLSLSPSLPSKLADVCSRALPACALSFSRPPLHAAAVKRLPSRTKTWEQRTVNHISSSFSK